MSAIVINSAESLSRALGDEEWRDIPGLEGRYQASRLGRIRSVTRVGATKLTDEQARCIKRRLLRGERVADIARDYPVSISAISEIKAGRSWGHLEVKV